MLIIEGRIQALVYKVKCIPNRILKIREEIKVEARNKQLTIVDKAQSQAKMG